MLLGYHRPGVHSTVCHVFAAVHMRCLHVVERSKACKASVRGQEHDVPGQSVEILQQCS